MLKCTVYTQRGVLFSELYTCISTIMLEQFQYSLKYDVQNVQKLY